MVLEQAYGSMQRNHQLKRPLSTRFLVCITVLCCKTIQAFQLQQSYGLTIDVEHPLSLSLPVVVPLSPPLASFQTPQALHFQTSWNQEEKDLWKREMTDIGHVLGHLYQRQQQQQQTQAPPSPPNLQSKERMGQGRETFRISLSKSLSRLDQLEQELDALEEELDLYALQQHPQRSQKSVEKPIPRELASSTSRNAPQFWSQMEASAYFSDPSRKSTAHDQVGERPFQALSHCSRFPTQTTDSVGAEMGRASPQQRQLPNNQHPLPQQWHDALAWSQSNGDETISTSRETRKKTKSKSKSKSDLQARTRKRGHAIQDTVDFVEEPIFFFVVPSLSISAVATPVLSP